MEPLWELLTERKEPLSLKDGLGDWQSLTIKFTGEVLPRERDSVFKGAMFAAYAGDLVFSKIDVRNGAVGLVPASIPKAVVTTEYPVLIPKSERLRPAFLDYLLRAEHFKADLMRQASGTSGRKRVTAEGFLSLKVPVPDLPEQDRLLTAYADALNTAAALEREAETLEREGIRAFETALGVAPPPPLPERPLFVARFKDIERWSHDGMLRATAQPNALSVICSTIPLSNVLLEVKHGCSLGPAKKQTTLRVLKISAVTKGWLDLAEDKYIADNRQIRKQFSLQQGDILMCRTNGTLAYVGMSALVREDVPDTIFPDKIIRLRPDTSKIDSAFLWKLLQLPLLRTQIEASARTAVGNFAIGGKDIKLLNAPVPQSLDEQRSLVTKLMASSQAAASKRSEAKALRATAWADFESALFEAGP